jgi:2',3'-cyclic-nucleotide 2'-phosphodiesterase (5'-nucleotidase family)
MRHRWFPPIIALALGCAPPAPAPDSGARGPVQLVVLSTTDVHGWLRGWDYYAGRPDSARGLARAATVIDSLRREAAGPVILVDAGDLLQGNPLAYVAARVAPDAPNPIIAAMNAMQYDAAAIGNHEFNYGIPYLRSAVAKARFPFVSANAYDVNGVRAFPAWHLVDRGGVKVGIVGATTPGVMIWDRENVRGQLVMRDLVLEVRRAVAEAREGGAEVIVVVLHSGLAGASSYDTASTGVGSENVSARVAREVMGIDLIVYGHSHDRMPDTTIGATMLQQPRNWAAEVGVARLTVERVDGRARVVATGGELIQVAGRSEHPAVLAAVAAAHESTISYVTTPIGTTPVVWRADSARVTDTPIIDFILEVERRATGAQLASAAAFSLDASLDAGPITVAELARLYPYDNTMRAVRITGRQLRDYLEHSAAVYYRTFRDGGASGGGSLIVPASPGYNFDIVAGVDYVIDLRLPGGGRITSLTFEGRPIVDTDTFTLALNNYRQTGGGNYSMLADAPVVYDQREEIRQLLIDEVRRRGTIRPEDYFSRNWRIDPPAAVARAYSDMHAARSPGAPPSSGSPIAAIDKSAAARALRRLRIIATSDFHGALEARRDPAGTLLGGASAVAAAIRQAGEECAPGCETLLVDAGDLFQGTPVSNLGYGRPVVELFNLLGYAATAVGNHEFDWGLDTLRARMDDARFRIMAANVRHADGSDVDWIPDDTLITRRDLRIGVIGIVTQTAPLTTRARNVAGLRFERPAPIVDARARALRARGADLVIVLAHAGASCAAGGAMRCRGEAIDLANEVTEPIAVIVSGHTSDVVAGQVRGTVIVQPQSTGRSIAVADIPFGAGAGARHPAAEIRHVFADSLPRVAWVDSLVGRWLGALAPRLAEPIAHFAETMPDLINGQFALGNYIADAQRWAAGADVAVFNTGGVRAHVLAGVATYGSLYEVQPFGNSLYRAAVTGTVLRAYLEQIVAILPLTAHVSGLTARFDPSKPRGSRLIAVMMADGSPLRDGATYVVTLNDFMVTGGDGLGLPPGAGPPEPVNIMDLEALIDYSRTRPQPIRAPESVRLMAIPGD